MFPPKEINNVRHLPWWAPFSFLWEWKYWQQTHSLLGACNANSRTTKFCMTAANLKGKSFHGKIFKTCLHIVLYVRTKRRNSLFLCVLKNCRQMLYENFVPCYKRTYYYMFVMKIVVLSMWNNTSLQAKGTPNTIHWWRTCKWHTEWIQHV